MIRAVIFALLAGFSIAANAAVYLAEGYISGGPNSGWHSTQAGACAELGYVWNGFNYCTVSSTDGSHTAVLISAESCPDGQSLNADGACVGAAPATCTAGSVVHSTFKTGSGPLGSHEASENLSPYPTSDGSCDVDYAVTSCYSVQNAAGTAYDFYCDYTGKETGDVTPAGTGTAPSAPSDTSTAQPAALPPTAVGSGKSCPAGTVNVGTDSDGGAICAGNGTSPGTPTTTVTNSPESTVTNADGSTTKTSVAQSTNPDGSVTTTTTTTLTQADGTQTTTTKVDTGSNLAGEAGQQSPDKSDFCAQHPELNACKNSTVTGECDQTACTGDAIQCAMLRQQRQQYCEDHTDTPQSTLGKQIFSGGDPLASTLPTPGNGQTVAFGSLDQSGFLGGSASCLADKPFTVQGQQFTLPFSSVCPYLLPFRYAMLIVAALVSLRLISKGVFQ